MPASLTRNGTVVTSSYEANDEVGLLNYSALYARIFSEPRIQTSPNFLRVYTYGRCLLLFWRRCDTLCSSCLVDDVIIFCVSRRRKFIGHRM